MEKSNSLILRTTLSYLKFAFKKPAMSIILKRTWAWKNIQLQNDSNTPCLQKRYPNLSEHICCVLGGGYFACHVRWDEPGTWGFGQFSCYHREREPTTSIPSQCLTSSAAKIEIWLPWEHEMDTSSRGRLEMRDWTREKCLGKGWVRIIALLPLQFTFWIMKKGQPIR